MNDLISPTELGAELGGASKVQVLEWRRQYGWPCVKVGKTIVFTPEQVAQIIASHSVTPSKRGVVGAVSIPGQTKRSARRAS